MSRPFLLLFASAITLIAGCGLKGALYLPEKSTTPVVITSPEQSSSSSSSSSTDNPSP